MILNGDRISICIDCHVVQNDSSSNVCVCSEPEVPVDGCPAKKGFRKGSILIFAVVTEPCQGGIQISIVVRLNELYHRIDRDAVAAVDDDR
jgi:hypothetical protein